jgi:TonB family protein
MEFKKSVKMGLQQKKSIGLKIGFATALLLGCMFFVPVMAQDTTTQKKKDIPELEEYPEFPGGEEGRMKFLNENIVYPIKARELGIEGRVMIGFVVEPDGSVSNIEVVKSVDPILDEEAVRVANLMPNWKPGKKYGKAVRSQYYMPITFELAGSTSNKTKNKKQK